MGRYSITPTFSILVVPILFKFLGIDWLMAISGCWIECKSVFLFRNIWKNNHKRTLISTFINLIPHKYFLELKWVYDTRESSSGLILLNVNLLHENVKLFVIGCGGGGCRTIIYKVNSHNPWRKLTNNQMSYWFLLVIGLRKGVTALDPMNCKA